MTSRPQASRLLVTARRAKAGGERFLGGLLAGASARRLQARAYADEWAAANIEARQASGPLWVVLGDSASQGIGATTRESGYVGVVHELLRRRDAWRVVNLSRAGAGVADVLARQLPELAGLTVDESAAVVTCIIGGEDVARRIPGLDIALRQVAAALPAGAVLGTVSSPRGAAPRIDGVIREEAARHGLRVAELPARSTILDDVGHGAWARAVITAIDGPPAEMASRTDPNLPVVTPTE